VPLALTYLSGPDVDALALTDDEILNAVEDGLRAQGEGRTVIEPRMHLIPGRDDQGREIRATSTCSAVTSLRSSSPA
jgi:ornithine cyclodeaminase